MPKYLVKGTTTWPKGSTLTAPEWEGIYSAASPDEAGKAAVVAVKAAWPAVETVTIKGVEPVK